MKTYISKLKEFTEKEDCPVCGVKLEKDGSLHVCKDQNIKIKTGEPTIEEQRKIFKNDIIQPTTEDGKINGEFIKIHGKKNHPEFNKKLKQDIKDAEMGLKNSKERKRTKQQREEKKMELRERINYKKKFY